MKLTRSLFFALFAAAIASCAGDEDPGGSSSALTDPMEVVELPIEEKPVYNSEKPWVDWFCRDDGSCVCFQKYHCYSSTDCSGTATEVSKGSCGPENQYASRAACAGGATPPCKTWCLNPPAAQCDDSKTCASPQTHCN